MGPQTKGKDAKRRGGKRSAHQLQQKVRSPKYGNNRKCNRGNPSRRGYHAMLTDVFSPCLVRLKIHFQVYRWLARYIYSGRVGYVRECDAWEWCLQHTGAVPLRYRHAHRRTDTWPVARRTHIEGTAEARRQYVERAFAVGFSACGSLRRGTAAARDVRRRHGGCGITFRPQSAAGDAEFET